MSLKDALKKSTQAELLHVASPRECNTQQMEKAQQKDATNALGKTPKAPNSGEFSCNSEMQQQCNTPGSRSFPEPREKAAVVARKEGVAEREIWMVYDHGLLVGWLVGMTFPEAVGRAQARWGRVNLVKAEKAEEESNV